MSRHHETRPYRASGFRAALMGIVAVVATASGLAQSQPIFQELPQELTSFQGNLSQDVALGDVDGNGSIDAIVAQDGANVLWVNDGGGVYTESGQSLGAGSSTAIALGDLDGDGDLDAWFGNFGDDEIWLNLGGAQGGTSGTYSNSLVLASEGTEQVELGDLDGDLDLDAVVLGSFPGIWWNTNGGQFEAGPELPAAAPFSLALADLDGDSDLDIVVGGEGFFFPTQIIWNDWNNSGQFTNGPAFFYDGIADGIAVTNLDNDAFPDVFIAGSVGGQAWWNNGDQTFTAGNLLGTDDYSGVALADLDGDGDQDAMVVRRNNAANGYWLNNGDRTFTAGPQALGNYNSYAVALADLNGDRRPDAFVANSGPNTVWFNIAPTGRPGAFVDSGQLLDVRMNGIALGDVDGDGDLDAVNASEFAPSDHSRLWINQGGTQGGTAGEFVDSGHRFEGPASRGVALGDLDGDGDLDVFFANRGGNTVWINQGGSQGGTAGTFTDSGQALGQSYSEKVALGDLDGDGDLDAAVANSLARARIWVNQGRLQGGVEGTFSGTELFFEMTPDTTDVAVGDIDNDGDLDLMINDRSDPVAYVNQGGLQGGTEGVFERSTFDTTNVGFLRGIALGDLDGDDDLDLYLGDYFEDRVWINQGGAQGQTPGEFVDSGQDLPGHRATKVALGDLDGTGGLDAFLVGDGNSQTWTNAGLAVFAASQSLGGGVGQGVALGDLDGDGDLDAFTATLRGGRIWLNGEINRLPVMSYALDLEPDPMGELVYNWWGRGNVIIPLRLSQPSDTEISVDVHTRLNNEGRMRYSPASTVVFPPGTTLQTMTAWPGEVGGRPGEIWNIYQGADDIDVDRVRYTIMLSNQTAGVILTTPAEFLVDVLNPDFGNRSCVLDGIRTLSSAAGGGGQAGGAAEPGTNDSLSLPTYRALRDQVLAMSPQGQYFIDLYEQTSPGLLQAVSDQAWLLQHAVNVVGTWAPAFQALAEGRGDEVTITPEMIAEGLDFLEYTSAVVSPELAAAIQAEVEALDITTWNGMTMTDALAAVQARQIPAQFTRVYLFEQGGDYYLHWWGEAGLSYRIQRSVGGLDAFESITDWIPGSGSGITELISTAPGATLFYQLAIQNSGE